MIAMRRRPTRDGGCTLAAMRSVRTAPRAEQAAARERDAQRTSRLLFDAELTSGALAPEDAITDAVIQALRVRDVPSRPVRLAQDLGRKLGRLESDAASLAAVRRSALGSGAAAPPRFLVRVDEFPHYLAWDEPQRFGTARFRHFNEIMHGAGLAYLIAVLPRVSRAPLDPRAVGTRPLEDDELTMLATLREQGVAFALHGHDHRTRFASPRRHSELCGLDEAATSALLDRALTELESSAGLRPDVFVAPYNRFDEAQWAQLAQRFGVVGGGPESIRHLGFQRPPQWRDGSVYLPAYAPFYGRAQDVLAAAERAIEQATGLWTPIVLHWGWEADAGWRELEQLGALIAPYAADWQEFREAVERSR